MDPRRSLRASSGAGGRSGIARAPRVAFWCSPTMGSWSAPTTVSQQKSSCEKWRWRVAAIVPRCAPEAKWAVLDPISERTSWQVPRGVELHALGTDCVSRRIVCKGILYPCQAVFLTPQARSFGPAAAEGLGSENLAATADEPFVVIEDAGVLVRQQLNLVEFAT